MKARKLKVCKNMDNDWMYRVYQNRGKGQNLLESCPLVDFQKKNKMHFAQ